MAHNRLYKVILATLTLVVAMNSRAEFYRSNKPVACEKLQALQEILYNQYREEAILFLSNQLPDTPTTIIMFNNSKTWTLVETNGVEACVLATGKKDDTQ